MLKGYRKLVHGPCSTGRLPAFMSMASNKEGLFCRGMHTQHFLSTEVVSCVYLLFDVDLEHNVVVECTIRLVVV